jgi:RNA polymerase sigma-70 factor (ECF subfamily)
MNASLEHIWLEFADRLRRFIRARVREPQAAEDILQDVFVKVQARLDQLKDPAKLSGWLHLIARNAVTDHYRARKETLPVPETLAGEVESEPPELEELITSFRRMLYSLPEPYREALVLTEFEGLTQAELAARLGISLSGAKSRVQRGRAQLKGMLLECCRFEFDRRGKVIECQPHGTSCEECGTR